MQSKDTDTGTLQHQVNQGISSAQTLLQGLLEERRALGQGIETIRTEFVSIKQQVLDLIKLLYHGDSGNPGIVTQLALIQKRLDDFGGNLQELKNKTEESFDEIQTKEIKQREWSRTLILSLVGSSGIASVLLWKLLEFLTGKSK